MAVDYNRQYIGARYVPTFFNNPDGSWDWAEGFQYEPLTIVKYGTSTFTSKKLVPSTVGAPNTAPEYWALTGEYNGAINSLQSDVNVLKAQNNSYNLTNRNIMLIGDSYGNGYTPEGSVTPWPELVISNLAFATLNIVTNSIGGSGWVGEGALFKDTVLNCPLSGLKPSDIQDIYICGGYNDINAVEATLRANILSGRNAIRGKYNNAKIHYIFIGATNATQQLRYKLMQVFNVSKAICESVGIDFIDGYNILHNINHFSSDNVHPNQNGQKTLAKYITEAIVSGEIHLYETDGNSFIINDTLYLAIPSSFTFSGSVIAGTQTQIVTNLSPFILKSAHNISFMAQILSGGYAGITTVIINQNNNTLSILLPTTQTLENPSLWKFNEFIPISLYL